jgi:hypothetical protein
MVSCNAALRTPEMKYLRNIEGKLSRGKTDNL